MAVKEKIVKEKTVKAKAAKAKAPAKAPVAKTKAAVAKPKAPVAKTKAPAKAAVAKPKAPVAKTKAPVAKPKAPVAKVEKKKVEAPKPEKAKFELIIDDLKAKAANFDASSYGGFLAIQVTLKDLKKVFYVEIKDGKLSVEPYEYNDRQAHIIISSADFDKLINGKLNAVLAFTTGKLKVEGDLGKAKELADLFA